MATRQWCLIKAKFRTSNASPVLKRLPAYAFVLLLVSSIADAQSRWVPGLEVFGGYSHLSFQSKGLGFENWTQMNGWEAALTIPHLYRGLGITGDVSGNYATALEQYNYAVGPQYIWEFSRFRVVGHGLFGRAQTRVRQAGSTFTEVSDRHRTILFGGELDYPLGDKFMWRVVQADYVVTSAFGDAQKNLRLSTGLIFRFGKH